MKPGWKALLFALSLGGALNAGTLLAGQDYEVAVYYFPGYHPDPRNDARLGEGWTEWDLIQAAKPRFPGHAQPKVPLWGYLDESKPRVFEKKIAAAADHGITSFIFDWYWYEDAPYLQGALDDGFLKAKNRDRLQFALMWANHDWIDIFPAKAGVTPKRLYPGVASRRTFDQATDAIIRKYFSQPNYWKIHGKPYFSIYQLTELVKGLGGLEQARDAFESFRARTKAAGLAGLHLNAVDWGVRPEGIADDTGALLTVLGIDSVTSYCWAHLVRLATFPGTPYREWARQSAAKLDGFQRQWSVPYFPNVSMGWDPSPRTTQSDAFKPGPYPYTAAVVGNTPAEFKKSLEKMKAFLDRQEGGLKIFTINAWNEWTEGSYLEPDTVNGLEYLEAIKELFPPAQAAIGAPRHREAR